MNAVLERPPDSQIGSFAGKLPLRHRLATALFAFAAPTVTFHGADISHYQNDAGPLNWTALREAGPWFACKATEGVSGVDPYFKFNRQQSRALKFTHRIWYHWLRPDSSPTLQARHFMDVVGELLPGEGIMLDVEQPGVTAAMVLEWCAEVWAQWAIFRRPIVIYTGAYVAGGTIWQSTAIRTSPFGRQPMHVAAYVTEARMRTLPGMTAYPPDGWQNSSDGPVPGVVRDKSVRCDMNHIFDWTAYNTACGVTNVPTPIPTEDDMIRLLAPADSTARFYATVDSQQRAIRCEWTGDGSDPVVAARLEHMRGATPAGQTFELVTDVANLIFVSLDGPLPPGLTAEQFANTAEIEARTAVGGPLHIEGTIVGTATPGGG